jgi:hypothetical protein
VTEKNAASCLQCGEFFPVEVSPQKEDVHVMDDALRCPKCQQIVAPMDATCPNCGEYLRELFEQKVVEKKPKEKPKAEKPIRKQVKPVLPDVREKEIQRDETVPVLSPRRSASFSFTLLFVILICCCFTAYGANWTWKKIFPVDIPISVTETPLVIATNTRIVTPTITLTPTITSTPTITFTPTVTPTLTNTPSPTATITPTLPAYKIINAQNITGLIPFLKLEGSKVGRGVAFSPDSRILASAGYDGSINIWDAYYGTLQNKFSGEMDKTLAVAFDSDGSSVYASGNDYTIYSMDIKTGDTLTSFFGHSGWVDRILFHPDGEIMASANGSVIIWNLETGKIIRTFHGDITDIAFTPDGEGIAIPEVITVVTGVGRTELIVHNPAIRIRDIGTGETTSIYSFSVSVPEPGSITSFSFSPDGQYIAAGGPENTVWWGSVNGSYLSKLYDFDSNAQITNITFSPNGDLLAVASSDSTIKIWDFNSKSLITTLEEHKDAVRYITFSPDGKSLTSSSDDGTVIIWRIK